MHLSRLPAALAITLSGTLALSGAAGAQVVQLANPFPNLTFSSPVELLNPGDGSNHLYVAEQAGRIRIFENNPGVTSAPNFLDIVARVASGGEMGLLGLAFDPDYATNGYFYVDYTVNSPRRTRISRFTRSTANPMEADPNSELILMEVGQPFSNHNAGAIAFGPPEGPDGERYLYITLGDGGSGGDPQDNGQNLGTLLGSILRLDVNGGGNALDCAAGTGAATVPPDNPFVGTTGACDEIYAYGFRNPWRMRFDPVGGWTLWAADVGQGTREEIDHVTAGGNYGWDVWEGTFCHEGPCTMPGFTFPVFEYNRTGGRISVTGGYVYRGSAIPELYGKYVYGDLSGPVWALDLSEAPPTNDLLLTYNQSCSGSYCLASFGEDEDGELYLLAVGGMVRKLVRNPPVGAEEEPASISSLALAGPNPADGRVTLRITAPPGRARVEIFDALGRVVSTPFDAETNGSDSRIVGFDTAGLAAGAYVARLQTAQGASSVRFSVVR